MIAKTTGFLLTPPRGAPLHIVGFFAEQVEISTHTPLAGRDLGRQHNDIGEQHFNSHAPRGARPNAGFNGTFIIDFNSHAPRGARPGRRNLSIYHLEFLLTRPSRGATPSEPVQPLPFRISTHTPLAGRDGGFPWQHPPGWKFLLTRPSRGATATFSM